MTAVLRQQTTFDVIDVLKNSFFELIEQFKKMIEARQITKYNALCIEMLRDMELIAKLYYKINEPLGDKNLKNLTKDLKEAYEKVNKIAFERMQHKENKSRKYDKEVFLSSLALIEIINFTLDDELMREFKGYKEQHSLIEFGKEIYA